MLIEFKARLALQMRNIAQASGKQIIHTDNIVAFSQKRITKM